MKYKHLGFLLGLLAKYTAKTGGIATIIDNILRTYLGHAGLVTLHIS